MFAIRQAANRAASRQLIKPAFAATAVRNYRHWWRLVPEDFGLPPTSMPTDTKSLLESNPKELGFIDSYWYWRLRAESVILDPENLPKKSYKQLSRDMGLMVVNKPAEHIFGLIELYEYLKGAPFVGPFGTIENPVLVPSVHQERVVGCTGGTGDQEHAVVWFRCREGFLYRCGECDQIFMHVRVVYSLSEEVKAIADTDVTDLFDVDVLTKTSKQWNTEEFHHWPIGHEASEYAQGRKPTEFPII